MWVQNRMWTNRLLHVEMSRKFLTFSRWALFRNRVWGTATVTPNRQLQDSSEKEGTGKQSDPRLPSEANPPTDTPDPLPDSPTPPPVATAVLPFRVKRSKQNNLPVYSDYKHGRAKAFTIVRKIEGDLMEMERMLRKHLNEKHLHTRIDELTGQIKIQGEYRETVREWLKSLGF